jgi:hypothetical protein
MDLFAATQRGTVDFYVAASALIALLLLAYLFQAHVLHPPRTTHGRVIRIVYSLVNMVICLGAEICALAGTYEGGDVSRFIMLWTWAGALSLTLHLGYLLVRRIVWYEHAPRVPEQSDPKAVAA